jgi:hypothetical protein
MKIAIGLVVLAFLTSPALAQNQAAAARASAGCGPDKVQFEVRTDKKQHAEAQPEAGKAIVYVFEDERQDPGALPLLAATIRIGLDGHWVGANHGKSYFLFAVDPGDHNLCASWQSSIKTFSQLASAASLSAEPGKAYYFQAKVNERSHDKPAVRLEAVDPAEAKLLIASFSLSISRPKN